MSYIDNHIIGVIYKFVDIGVEITNASTCKDLELDSLDLVELGAHLDEEIEAYVYHGKIEECKTVQEIIDVVKENCIER